METVGAVKGVFGERRIVDLMTPPSAYRRVCEDEPVQRVVQLLMQSLFHPRSVRRFEPGHRSVLVYSRGGAFLGCIRLNDVLELLAPGAAQRGAPVRSGMLAARSGLIASMTAGEILGEQRFIDVDAPLLEAVQIMVLDGLINIPVLRRGELVGVLTDKIVLREICAYVAGGGDGGARKPAENAAPKKSLPRAPALSRRHRRLAPESSRRVTAGAGQRA